MRYDMAKVLVERPRLGGGTGYPRNDASWQRTVPEHWPHHEPMGMEWHPCRKWLNENLAPLRRFLRSRCGQPWDRVYSEICQRINRNSAVQLHIWQHLVDFVCTDATIYGREVRDSKGDELRGWTAFYVHPTTRILCEVKHRPKSWWRRRQLPRDRVPIDDGDEYRLLNGLWFRVTFAPLPVDRNARDMIHGKPIKVLTREEITWRNGQPHYAATKRQLGKKEIRRAGLVNKRAGDGVAEQ